MTAVRTLLSVVVAAALLGASLPALDDARTARTEQSMETTATRLAEAATTLASTDDPAPPDAPGARRTLSVTVPSAGLDTARVDYLAVGGTPNTAGPSTLTYRLSGQSTQSVETGVRFVTGPSPLVLPPGRHVLRLTLVRTPRGVGVGVRVVGRERRPTPRANATERSES